MITTDKFISGVNSYLDDSILPSVGGLMKWGLAIGVGAYIGNILNSGVLQKLGYQQPDGMIDIDRLYTDLRNTASRTGSVTQSIPLVGGITFSTADVEELYRRLK